MVSFRLYRFHLSRNSTRYPFAEEAAWALRVGLNDLENGTQIVKLIVWTVMRGRRV